MTTLISAPATVTVVTPGTSALSVMAAAMSAGQWSNFTIPGLDLSTQNGNVETLITYAARGVWDSTRKQMSFYGQAHTGGQVGLPASSGFVRWDDATNTFYREMYPSSALDVAHAYNHLTVNSATGYLYQRRVDSVLRRPPNSIGGLGAWQTGFVANINPPSASGEIYNALEWYPELNGGQGGLVYAGVLGVKYTNAALTSWSQSPTMMSGNYQNWVARSGGYIYWGGGAGSSSMYRMSATPTFATMPNTPIPGGTNADAGIVLPHPNGTELLMFGTSSGGQMYKFDGSTWRSIGVHQLGGQFWIGFTVREYGVVVFLLHPGGTGPASCKVFKP
jgi:hypothetical protein